MKTLSSTELKYIEVAIIQTQAAIRENFHPTVEPEPGYIISYDQNELDVAIIFGFRKLYLLMLSYFEGKGLKNYAKEFRKEFAVDIDKNEKLLEIEVYDGDNYLVMTSRFARYLYPFKSFSYHKAKEDGFQKVLSIVSETAHILGRLKQKAINEPIVYKTVQWILNFYFDTRPTNNTRFLRKFKTYRPDIVIPELETAIEFKLVKKKQTLDDYIDQLATDARNYVGDPQYKEFIAVLCLTENIAPKRDIEISWQEKKFSKNWHLVVVSL